MKKVIISIIGRPGSGKSMLVRRFLREAADDWQIKLLTKMLPGYYSPKLNLYVLGDYSNPTEIFPGTDRLSMAVPPHFLAWLASSKCDGHVLFEGDRLGNASTLRCISLLPQTQLRIYLLKTAEHELVRRYMVRGSAQNQQVLRARATKIANIAKNPNLQNFLLTRCNQTQDEQQAILDELIEFIEMP